MKGLILKHLILFVLVILSGAALMNVSQHVQLVERQIKISERDIAREGENIRILNAEWAYLNNPARLEILAAGGLGLMSPKAANLVSDVSKTDSETNIKSYVIAPPLAKSPLHIDISYSSSAPDGETLNTPSQKPLQATSPTLMNKIQPSSNNNRGAR